MSEPVLGLRERKKQLTRASIADATLQLAVEKGMEQVTIEDIARAAFVSARTVSNYFSCKEEAVAAAGRNLADTIDEDLARRPSGEAALESMRRVTVDFIASLTDEELHAQREKRRLGERYPAIKAYLMARYDLTEDLVRAEIASRSGADVDDTYPWLLAAAAVAAVRVTSTRWANSDADRHELMTMMEYAFDQLQGGLQTA